MVGATVNGCHNRPPFVDLVLQQSPVWDSEKGKYALPELVRIPHRMAKDCQYTLTELGQADKGCDGCIHKQ